MDKLPKLCYHSNIYSMSVTLLSTAALILFYPLILLIMCHRGDRSDAIVWGDRGWHLPPHPRHWIGRHDWRTNTSDGWRCVGSFINVITCSCSCNSFIRTIDVWNCSVDEVYRNTSMFLRLVNRHIFLLKVINMLIHKVINMLIDPYVYIIDPRKM